MGLFTKKEYKQETLAGKCSTCKYWTRNSAKGYDDEHYLLGVCRGGPPTAGMTETRFTMPPQDEWCRLHTTKG